MKRIQIKKIEEKKINLYFREYFKLAKLDNIAFISLEFVAVDLYWKDNIYIRLKQLYLMLDTFFFFKRNKKQFIVIGLKSILGYNPDLVRNISRDLSDGIELDAVSVKQISTEKEYDKLSKAILRYIKDNSAESLFEFKQETRIDAVYKIIDKALEPLSESNNNIKFHFFQNQSWINVFIPIYHQDNYDYAILNLIRLDFAEKSLTVFNGDIKRYEKENNQYKHVMTVDEYMDQLPRLLSSLKIRFSFQLYYFNYENLLVVHASKIKSYFEMKYLLPSSNM